jgi:hypothetical protein
VRVPAIEQSVDEYIEFLHSTSVLTRAQLGDRAESFDAEVRAVFAPQDQSAALRSGRFCDVGRA